MAVDLAQEFLFQRIREIIPRDVILVDAVAEILNVSSDSAYRRIRGETALVLEEARLLCSRFHLSLDQLMSVNSNTTVFQISRVDAKDYTFDIYLKDILHQLKYIEGCASKEIIILTKDLHIFANMISQPFFAFRYFFWNKSVTPSPEYATRGFSLDCLSPEIIAVSQEMLKTYNRIPSTEIWNIEAVNSIILQVDYYKEAGLFSSSADIKAVYESVEETLYHLRDEVELGTKFSPGENASLKKPNFRFFYNRIMLGDNAFVVTTDQIKTVYLNYDVLNIMTTRDEKFCTDTYQQMQNLMRRSTQISESSEKQRNAFFNILISKIEGRKLHL